MLGAGLVGVLAGVRALVLIRPARAGAPDATPAAELAAA